MMNRMLSACAAVAVAALAGPTPAIAQLTQPRVEIGVLTCRIAPGVGLVVGSKRDIACELKRAAGPPDRYVGAITKIGLDIGITNEAILSWGVLAATDIPNGALAGTYGGVTAGASVGAGVGANALVGGSNHGIVLQPLSVQAQQGLNIAAGVAQLELRPALR